MTKNLFRILLFLLLPLAGQAKDADSLRVLWVGNSYTYYNDMPAIVQQIAATQKVKVSCTRFLKGGERFSGHLTNQKLLKALAAGGWDYVVLQEQSSAPAMPTRQVAREVYPQARTLDSLVHAGSPDARVIFYMTWGHKNGNRFPIPEYPPINRYETMQERLITSYLEMAYDNDAWCAPRGYGVAPRACRTSRLRALCAGLFSPRAAGQLPRGQRDLHDHLRQTLPDRLHDGPSARTGRIPPAHSPANGPRKPDAAQSRITRRPDSTAEPG